MYKIILFFLVLMIVNVISQENNSPKKSISTAKAPQAIGPYSQAIESGDFIYLSGQIGLNPETGKLIQDSFKSEVKQVMDNIKAIIESAGLKMDNVVKSTVYLTDLSNFSEFNSIYAEYFKEPYPARETVQVTALPKGAKIEISVVCHK